MNRIDQLTGLQRKLTSARELNDALLLEVLQLCSRTPAEAVSKKYLLMQFCHEAAWEQAALWIFVRSFESWRLQLSFTPQESKATLLSGHAPPFTIEVTNVRAATAILLAMVQAAAIMERLGIDTQP